MNKSNRLVAVLVVALSLIMCGCEKESKMANENSIKSDSVEVPNAEVEDKLENVTEVPNDTITANADVQLMIIAQNKDMWTEELEYADEVYRYVISDLDHNGRYEVIVSNMGGTGLYTYSRFWEVNETLDGLEECNTDFMEGDSQPDLIIETVDTYIDENGEFHYAFYDVLRNGMAESYENVRELILRDGEIITKYIASKSNIYEGDVLSVTCVDQEGNSITEEEYQTMADNYFIDCQKVVTNLGWHDVRQLPDEIDGIMEQLRDSFTVFLKLE